MNMETDNQQKNTVIGTGQPHAGGGIKNTFHGVSYQMKLPMLYVVRGLKQNCKFQVATEVEEAGKLDDLLFLYENDEIGFFQAKHKLNEDLKITEDQLLGTEGDFSIKKYYNSYNRILEEKQLKNVLKDRNMILVIITNIGFDCSVSENFDHITASSILSDNRILALGTKKEREEYYIVKRKSTLYDKLRHSLEVLEQPTTRLAENLATAVVNNKKKSIKVDELFQRYREWLQDNVLEVGKEDNKLQIKYFVTFKNSFLSGSGENVLKFWNTFSETYLSKKETGKEVTTNVKKDLAGVRFQIPKHFALNVTTKPRQGEVGKFLDKVVFAVNQPNEIALGDIIEKEIGDYVGHTARLSISCTYKLYIQDWAKQKAGRYLTNEDVERQFAVWGYDTLNQMKMDDIKKYGCTFEESNDVIKKLSNFLKTENDVNVFCLYNTETLFTKIKVCQVLESFATENIDQKFIFCDIKDLIELENSKKCPVKAFSAYTCNTLFVSLQDCKFCQDEVKMLNRLLKIVIECTSNAEQPHTNKQRKRLIVTIAEEKKSEFFKKFSFNDYGIKHLSLNDFDNSFCELDEKSRRQLMQKGRMKLQGNYITGLLSEIDLTPYIRNEILLKLISSELEINDAILNTNHINEEVNQCYVTRSLVPANVSQDITTDPKFYFIREVASQMDIGAKEVVVVSETDMLFEHFCKRHTNVHWLKENSNKYVWITSRGTVNNLRKYVSAQNSDLDDESEYDISITDVSDLKNNVVLISASPGMGKSIMLSHIAEQSKNKDASFFISKSNLVNYCAVLDRLNENNVTFKQAIHFIFHITQIESPQIAESQSAFNLLTVQKDGSISFAPNARFGHLDHLRAMIFYTLYSTEKIVLLLDGFDEIAPNYCKTTLTLLQMLKRCKVPKIWVTTRPYGNTKDLENNLDTFAYSLKPLSRNDQLIYFVNFWGHKIKSPHAKIQSCVEHFFNLLNTSTLSVIQEAERKHSSDKSNPSFMSVPLHSYMLADVLTDEFIKFCSQNKNNAFALTSFTIFDLYYNFFNVKFDKILLNTNTKAPKNDLFQDIKKDCETNHGKLALLEIFDEKLLTELVPGEDRVKLLNSVKNGKEKTGLVTEVIDNKPRFVHRTFAEYFAAHYLATIILSSKMENGKKEAAKSLLYNSVTGNSEYYYALFTFFNYKVVSESENKEIFEAALGGNIEKLSKTENVNEMVDRLNRTPMHLIAFNLFNVLENFENVSQPADLTTATAMYNNYQIFFQRLCQSMMKHYTDALFKWTPTHYFTVRPFDTISQKNSILFQYINEGTQDTLGRTPLMLLILNRSFCMRWMISSLPFNLPCVDVQDQFLKTALHYAVIKFQEFMTNNLNNGGCVGIYLAELEIICFLLKHGARINIHDNQGIAPVDVMNSMAEKYKFPLEMFFDHEKDILLKYDTKDITEIYLHYVTQYAHKHGNDNAFGARNKSSIKNNINNVLKCIVLRQLLDEYDQPILPVLNSEVFTLLFTNKLSPEIAKHLFETTEFLTTFLSKDNHKSIFIFMLTVTKSIAQILLDKVPHLVDVVDSRGRTALHYAIRNRNARCVTYLIKNNARVDILDNKGKMPAHVNKLNILKHSSNQIYFHHAHDKHIFEFINTLAREVAGPLVSTMNLYPIQTRIDANFIVNVMCNTDTIADIILEHYPDAVNIKDSEGRTALHYAVLRQEGDTIRRLIYNNARADIADKDGNYPAHLDKDNQGNQELQNTYDARNRNMLSFIDTLPFDVAKPLILSMTLVPPLTPSDHELLNYILAEHHTIASVLWAEYSDLVGTSTLVENCSYFDCAKVSNEVVCILLKIFCIEEFSDDAVKSNDILKLVVELLRSVKNKDWSRMLTVLRCVEYSVVRPNFANVNLLSVNVACSVVNATSKDGYKTALHYLAEIGNVEMAQSLLSHGAWFNVPDLHGSTPTQIAETHGSTDVLHLLHMVEHLFDRLFTYEYEDAKSIIMKKKFDGNLFNSTCYEKRLSLMELILEKNDTCLLESVLECYDFKADLFDYKDLNYFSGDTNYNLIDKMNLNETVLRVSNANLVKILELIILD